MGGGKNSPVHERHSQGPAKGVLQLEKHITHLFVVVPLATKNAQNKSASNGAKAEAGAVCYSYGRSDAAQNSLRFGVGRCRKRGGAAVYPTRRAAGQGGVVEQRLQTEPHLNC